MSNLKNIHSVVEQFSEQNPDQWNTSALGVTRLETQIPFLESVHTPNVNIVVVGGLVGGEADVNTSIKAIEACVDSTLNISIAPCINIDGYEQLQSPNNSSGGSPSLGYPPDDGFFNDEENPESRYMWRWISYLAPEVVVEICNGEVVEWESNLAAQEIATELNANPISKDDSFINALGYSRASGLGVIPAFRLSAPEGSVVSELTKLIALSGSIPLSQARKTLESRRQRSPIATARVLASTYGHKLDNPINYVQGVGISGRIRLWEMDGGVTNNPIHEIAGLTENYVSGAIDPYADNPAGSAHIAGMVWADEMFLSSGDERYKQTIIDAANLFEEGSASNPPHPADPLWRTEDMFMLGSILGRAYSLTGEEAYLQKLVTFLKNMKTQKSDGLFMHDRNTDIFWGRGNGFAAIGLTETLSVLPEDHPERPSILKSYRRLLEGLKSYQQPSGRWLEIIDLKGSYEEMTGTCMIGYAVARGLRKGWIDSSNMEWVNKIWVGASERIADNGDVMDGCISTGAMESIRDYLDRTAVCGYDDRTGSLALWFAVEMSRLLEGRK
ncbi:MAG: glycoside hydrolase family 88 protein [Dehalococcoidia bacterium]